MTSARICSSIFLLVGGVILFFGVKSLISAKASESWPTVRGKIISSSVESNSGKNGTTYHAEVRYEYNVAGRVQSSNQVAFGDYGSSNPSDIHRIVMRYPAGAEVVVHYSPTSLTESVLETGISGKTFLLPGFGSIFFVIGLGVFNFWPGIIQGQRAAQAARPTSE